MAYIAARAYRNVPPNADVDIFNRNYQLAILNLVDQELAPPALSAADYQNLRVTLINPIQAHYTNPVNDQAHFHLPPPHQGVTVIQWPADGAAAKISLSMFNVYDLLAVAHSVITRKYGWLPMQGRSDKRIDKPVPFSQILRAGQERLGPEPIIQILESLRQCCVVFSLPRNGKQPRTQSMASTAGYSVPVNVPAPYPNFGVSAAGDKAQKADIVAARLSRFSQNVRSTPKVATWACGNCAEQAYWPVQGDARVEYEGITVMVRNFQGTTVIAPGKSEENCPNCKAMAVRMVAEGFQLRDLANLGRDFNAMRLNERAAQFGQMTTG